MMTFEQKIVYSPLIPLPCTGKLYNTQQQKFFCAAATIGMTLDDIKDHHVRVALGILIKQAAIGVDIDNAPMDPDFNLSTFSKMVRDIEGRTVTGLKIKTVNPITFAYGEEEKHDNG